MMKGVRAGMDDAKFRIAIAQMEVVVGQPTKNLQVMSGFVKRAKDAGADLIVFPDHCLGGRFLGSRVEDSAFMDYLHGFSDKVRALSDGITIVFGNPCRFADADNAYFTFESMPFVARDGAWLEESWDDDGFYRLPGTDVAQLAVAIYAGPVLDQTFASIAMAEDLQSSDLVINIGAEPWTRGSDGACADAIAHASELAGSLPPVVHVNCVGMQNTDKDVLAFDGGSAVFLSDGTVAARARDDFEEDLVVVDIDLMAREATVVQDTRLPRYASEDEKVLDAIVGALRRFDAQVFPFHPKWIIGLSGGLDSSVTAALMHLAFGGSERIVGYNLATRYNSDATKMNAYELAQALGIRLVNGSIEDVISATNNVMALYGYPPEACEGLVQENIQARLRGHMLSTFAAVEGGVIMNNGNKVEVALGYATLYGDAIGAISPIGDITKVQLFRLARTINARLGIEAVPMNLVPEETEDGYLWETMPSAELKDAQRDPMKWFYHDWLVENLVDADGLGVEGVMSQYLEDKLASTEVAKWVKFYGLDDPQAFIDDLAWVLKQKNGNVFKRIQLPPAIKLSHVPAYAAFRENQSRFEQTARFQELEQAILDRG